MSKSGGTRLQLVGTRSRAIRRGVSMTVFIRINWCVFAVQVHWTGNAGLRGSAVPPATSHQPLATSH